MTHEASIALLIDADNSPANKIEEIIDELAKYGVINIRRAYGNWKSQGLKSWEAVLHDYAIQPIQQFAYTKGKNATDSAMIIDAMDLLYTQKLDGFCLASSDSDFTPLVMRIRANGLKVFGFGEQKTPEAFKNACHKFVFTEVLRPASRAVEPVAAAPRSRSVKVASAPQPQRETLKTRNDFPKEFVLDALEQSSDDAGWANLGTFGRYLTNLQPDFDSRIYGYKKLSDLVKARTDLFITEERVPPGANQKTLYLRAK